MVRVVFFSFDYDDVWRVNQVRNSGAFVGEQRSGFRDKAEYEQVKRSGDTAIKQWIRKQMRGCSVTCVLIGTDTHRSRWVKFEIAETIANGMGLLGIYIHRLHMPNDERNAVLDMLVQPHNPLDDHDMPPKDQFDQLYPAKASAHFQTHTWEPQSMFSWTNDLGAWVEEAARRAGR